MDVGWDNESGLTLHLVLRIGHSHTGASPSNHFDIVHTVADGDHMSPIYSERFRYTTERFFLSYIGAGQFQISFFTENNRNRGRSVFLDKRLTQGHIFWFSSYNYLVPR